MKVCLTIHRSAAEIGGNCIEVANNGSRLLLDIGRPLDQDLADVSDLELIPPSLNLATPIDAVLISHPHQDHYGLLSAIPQSCPVWSGEATEKLIRLTTDIFRKQVRNSFHNFKHLEKFTIGNFAITPYLTDHSAFDAYMYLIEIGGKKLLYTGDFRLHGRKARITKQLMENPPKGVDVLIMEGTNVGRVSDHPSEADIENRFVDLFTRTRGRVFVTWSAQNIDRTVSIFKACKRTGRKLVIDIYTAHVLKTLGHYARLPQPDWSDIRVVITSRLNRLYSRIGKGAFVNEVCVPNGMGAAKLQKNQDKWVVMVRKSMIQDFANKGVKPTSEDSWSFSMWKGYLVEPDCKMLQDWFETGNSNIEHIHTSGHASLEALQSFSRAIAPRYLVPIHSFDWDENIKSFSNTKQLKNGETLVV